MKLFTIALSCFQELTSLIHFGFKTDVLSNKAALQTPSVDPFLMTPVLWYIAGTSISKFYFKIIFSMTS